MMLGHTITDPTMKLFCVVEGESAPFPIEIETTKTIGDLKKAIKSDNTIAFADVDAKVLTPWRVSIKVDSDDNIPFTLGSVPEKTKLRATSELSDVFDEAPPKNTIHIIVQRPTPANDSSTSTSVPLLSKSDVLSRILPSLRHARYQSPSSSTTESSFGRGPTTVSKWTDFPMQAALRDHPTNRTFSPDDFRFSNDLVLSNEESVCSALDANLYNFLNRLNTTGRIGTSAEAKVIGKPDRVYFVSPGDARMLIEIKTSWALSCDDLVAKYSEDMDRITREFSPANHTLHQVHQIFGYLSCNLLRYGILTTYDQTWFMRRDGGTLWISPSVHHSNIQPTLLQCYVHLMELSGQDHTSPPAPPSPLHGPQLETPHSDDDDDDDDDSDDGDYHAQKKLTKDLGQQHSGVITRSKSRTQRFSQQLSSGSTIAVGKLNLGEFEIQEPLGEGRTGRVFHATWQGEPVALKICDLYKNPEYEDEILTEVAAYKALEDLQGVCIPRIKIAGYDGGIFAIAMEIAGFPVEVDKLSHQEHLEVVNSLSLIHQHGIIHNDIRHNNVLVRHVNNVFQVRFIDFALSRQTRDKLRLKQEMIKLKYLLHMGQTSNRPRSRSTCHSRLFSTLDQPLSSIEYTGNQTQAAQKKLKYMC